MTTITSDIKVAIVTAIAQYNTCGSQSIDNAFDIYSDNGGTMDDIEFMNKVKWEHNENLHEIDNIGFMYDIDTEEWASDDEMSAWYDANISE